MAVASGSPVHAQLNATLTAPDLCPKVAPSPRAQSSSFVTAASLSPNSSQSNRPSASPPPLRLRIHRNRTAHRHRNPLRQRNPVAIEFPRQRPQSPFAIETSAAELHRPRSPTTSKPSIPKPTATETPSSPNTFSGPVAAPSPLTKISGNVVRNLEIEILRAEGACVRQRLLRWRNFRWRREFDCDGGFVCVGIRRRRYFRLRR